MLCSHGLLVLLLVLSFETTIIAREVEFDYDKRSKRGPEHWGDIKEEWRTCKTGKMQSPIDLLHERVSVVPESEKITRFYKPGRAILKNRGHNIELECKDKNSRIQINGTDYILQQSHWHSPSEHTINGKRFALELHMVHQSSDKKIAVIGLLYKIGKPDKFLSELSEKIKLSSGHEEFDAGVINPENIKKSGSMYYRYNGSLTTPPCTEGVIWTVDKQLATVSEEQIKLLREAAHDHAQKNARPLQPLNGRKVQLYVQKIRNYPH